MGAVGLHVEFSFLPNDSECDFVYVAILLDSVGGALTGRYDWKGMRYWISLQKCC